MRQIIDSQTIVGLKQGDTTALSLVYSIYADRVYCLAFKFLKDTGWSEDLVQDVFIKVWNNREQLNESISLWPIIYTITKRESLNKLRSIRRSQEAFDKLLFYVQGFSDEADQALLNRELAEKIEACFAELPVQQEKAIIMSRVEGMSHREIADELKISQNTVKNHIVQAIKTLKKSPLSKDALQTLCLLYLLNK